MERSLRASCWIGGFAALLLIGVAGAAPAPEADKPLQELDEVQVYGTRLWKMRSDMIALEDRFYALYNELNRNNDFVVKCRWEAPLGTRIRSRRCKVAYLENAEAEYARSLLAGYVAPEPQLVELERQKEYQLVALQVINSDARLRRLRFKGRLIRFE